jgi:hypothetical protein
MANSYNSNPIILDTDMASGWRSLQTLNTGNSPATIQNPNPAPRQWGIRPYKILLQSNGVTNVGLVLVTDPIDGTILYQDDVPSAVGAAGTVIPNDHPDFNPITATWRDFKVTGLTATVSKMTIWYRA